MFDNRPNGIVDNFLCPQWCKTKAGHAENQSANSQSLIPGSIVEVEELCVLYLLEQNLTTHTQDVYGSNNDRSTCNDGGYTMEHIGILESSHEDRHLSNKTREAWKTEVGQTSNHVSHAKEWDNLHETTQITHVASTCTVV